MAVVAEVIKQDKVVSRYGAIRLCSEGKDILLIARVEIKNNQHIAAKNDAIRKLKEKYEVSSVTWIGWFDKWLVSNFPNSIKLT